MTKKKKQKAAESAPASYEVPGSGSAAYSKPRPRPYPKRHRVTVSFPDKGMTRGSFKDECDIDKIVGKFVDTGMITHMQRGKPEYGDAPDQTLFEAAITQAELRSATEDGTFEEYADSQEAASEAAEQENDPEPGSTPGNGEKKAPEAQNEAAELTSRAE